MVGILYQPSKCSSHPRVVIEMTLRASISRFGGIHLDAMLAYIQVSTKSKRSHHLVPRGVLSWAEPMRENINMWYNEAECLPKSQNR